MENNNEKLYDVVIIGGGPAGLSAAIYAGRSNMKTLIAERGAYGGTVFQTAEIANYPGGIPDETGAAFSARLEAHADAFGAEKITGEVTLVNLIGPVKDVTVGGKTYQGRTLILATGNVPAKLGIPGEDELAGLGVSYCAICDGPFFSGLDVYVVGGGDSAVEESLYLAKFSRHVTIIHRRDAFRAAKSIVEKAEKAENISFLLDTVVTGVSGDPLLSRLTTENVKTGEQGVIEAAENENFGLFIFTGLRPQTEIFGNALDTENGYIVTDEKMATNIPGVFAAGDVRKKSLRQIVTATADGAIAALEAEKYLIRD
ncbi:MAG: FAD-dependent oxidoreductase [Clostridiales Family XIII bacterium]|jgi:thioredoxin reductase (NADPH)|nr:FAD-dependent oxidoreductase [Clostridiales Family XIII bacterium]